MSSRAALRGASDLVRRGALYIGMAGAACLLLAFYATPADDRAAAIAFGALGVGAIVIAAFAPQIASLRLGPSGVELTLVGIVATPEAERFVGGITGYWWEVIDSRSDRSAVSLCTIWLDPTRTVRLHGSGYSKDGSESANWRSQMVRLFPSELRLIYLWTGEYAGAESNRHFHGLGTLNFDPTDPVSHASSHAAGPFWHVDEAMPSATKFNDVRLHRAIDPSEVDMMRNGNRQKRAAVVAALLARWPRPAPSADLT